MNAFMGMVFLTMGVVAIAGRTDAAAQKKWVGTWACAPQLVESANLPPSPGLTGNTLRQVIRVSIGGDSLRVRFSNEFSTSSVKINSAAIAVCAGGGAINASTQKTLKFSGSAGVTMNANSSVTSDAVAFNLAPRTSLSITLYFGQTSSTVTGHPGSRTTSYLLSGDQTASADFSGAVKTEHWYMINAIDTWAPSFAAAVAILGNSITDGRGSVSDSQNRWPDILSERLVKNPGTQQVGVLNLGIGANCMVGSCTGPSGVSRFKSDILNQQGVAWAMVFEGVNDIGSVTTAASATSMASSLINAYKQFITDAHAQKIKIYGATIMAFEGNGYYNASSESCRQTVNKWIRTAGLYDSIIDFDKVTRSSSDTAKLGIVSYQNDGLHPDAAGYKKMGEAINLNLFSQSAAPVKRASDVPDTKGMEINLIRRSGAIRVLFHLDREAYVSIRAYSLLGKEITGLSGRNYGAAEHAVEFKNENLSRGISLIVFTINGNEVVRKALW